jgi:signal transduction histidine kinase
MMRELAEPALGELDRIGSLVSDLLAFARRDDDSLELAEVDLADVCRDALAQMNSLAASSGVDVDCSLASAPVLGDRRRLVQVVANLCRNAVEALAASNGDRRIALRCASEHGHAVAEVRDSGPGVPIEEAERIFEPFHTTKSEGTGLGLAIARRIARAHGGDLGLASSAEGQSFRLSLPLHPRGV